jgi:hypothetical protein
VEYKSGATNIVADALSRRDTAEAGELMALSLPTFALFDELRAELAGDPELRSLRDEVMAGGRGEQWQVVDGLITTRGKLYVPASSPSVPHILESVHGIGHEGTEKTLHRLRVDFRNPGVRKAVRDFVRACATCQRNKTEQLHPTGLFQPLELASTIWADVAMDFVEGFPRVHGKSVTLTVVDRFSKYAHFLPLGHPYTATSVARVFFDGVVRLHGIPSSIVSDRDPVFMSQFWRELFALSGAQHVIGVPPSEQQVVRGDQQSHYHVPSVPRGGSATQLATMAAMGRVLLQLNLPFLDPDITLQSRLRQGASVGACLHDWGSQVAGGTTTADDEG